MTNTLAHLTARVAALESAKANMMQLAKVTLVDDTTNLVDVEVRGVPLTGVPFITMRAGAMGQTYWLPEVGELGLLFSPGGDVANAVFQPAMFYEGMPAPENDANIMRRRFTNVAEEKWDGNDNRHVLQLDSNAKRQTDQEPAKIEDNAGDSKVTLDSAGTAKLEASSTAKLEIQQSGNAELAVSGGTIKIDGSKTNVERATGSIEVKVGLTRLVIGVAGITGYVAGIGRIQLAAASVNIGGATFVNGATNLITAVGPVTYPPVPIT